MLGYVEAAKAASKSGSESWGVIAGLAGDAKAAEGVREAAGALLPELVMHALDSQLFVTWVWVWTVVSAFGWQPLSSRFGVWACRVRTVGLWAVALGEGKNICRDAC